MFMLFLYIIWKEKKPPLSSRFSHHPINYCLFIYAFVRAFVRAFISMKGSRQQSI